jgi:uncharacterized protein YkwD
MAYKSISNPSKSYKSKKAPPTGLVRTIKQLVYPHPGNNHHPHAIRHQALAIYLVVLLAFNIGYNVVFAHSSKVLGFATAISQSEIIRLTIQTRLANGVGSLRESPLLDKSATLKAQNMFAEDYWAHYAPSGKSPWYWFDQAGYVYTLAGENLARDFDTSQGVIDGWMNSPTHRANMLAPGYQDIGIAVMNGVMQGHETTLVVQHFGTTATSNTPVAPAGNISPTQTPPKTPAQVATTPAPTVQEQTIGQENSTPSVEGATGIPSSTLNQIQQLPYQLLHPQPINSWGVPQTVTVVFLAILMLLFLFDSSVLWRKGLQRTHSHSLLHAGALGVLMLLVVYSAAGGVL